MRKHFLFVVVLIFYCAVCLYRIDEIPGEWFGDISNLHEMVLPILNGQPVWYYFQSEGPLYPYFVSLFAHVGSTTYFTYKIASIVMGALGLIATYLMLSLLVSHAVAVLTAAVSSVSFWYIVWARLGSSPHIIAPFLTASTVYFLLLYKQNKKNVFLFLGSMCASAGLVSYPGLFTLPFVYLVLSQSKWKSLVFLVPGIILFYITFSQGGINGYVVSKIPSVTVSTISSYVKTSTEYFVRTFVMFFIKGDHTFRVNIPDKPQLDAVSQLFLLIGSLFLFGKKYRKVVPYIIVPILILILPSVSPALPSIEVPNSGRTLGIIPFVYALVAIGIYESTIFIKEKIRPVFLILLMSVIAFMNIFAYFGPYKEQLPNRNSPYGRIIAKYIDSLSPDTIVYLSDCCWGERGQPEPKAIFYSMKHQSGRWSIVSDTFIHNCHDIRENRNFVIIVNPYSVDRQANFSSCFPNARGVMHTDRYNQQVFFSLTQ